MNNARSTSPHTPSSHSPSSQPASSQPASSQPSNPLTIPETFDASAPSPVFSEKGVYCLVFENRECTLSVGKKGDFSFRPGYHIYVGSALGPGGLKRVIRHIKLSENRDKKPKWHVDYLHLSPAFSLACVVCAPTSKRLECVLASEIGGDSVPGFGCTDCKCKSHLFYRADEPEREILEAFKSCGLLPSEFRCKNQV